MKSQNFDSYLPVVGYEGLYELSFRGHVRNARTGQILKPILNTSGYQRLVLCKNGKKKKFYIHRLVASVWIPNIDNEPCVDHIDHNKTNNAFWNLRWVSLSDNQRNRSLSTNNTSGMQGVCFRVNKGIGYWVAQWFDNEGRSHGKCFCVKKFNNAKELAIEYRNQMVLQYYNRV
jgi:hypothetical protein